MSKTGLPSPPDGRAVPDNRSLIDADTVVYRLEEAGSTVLALPGGGWTTRLRTSSLDIVRTALESYGWTENRVRPAVPPAARIDRMDEAFGWIGLIPQDRFVLRRIVGARSLVSPITERHLFPWRRLAGVLGADHKAVQRWHAQGIALIVAALRARSQPQPAAVQPASRDKVTIRSVRSSSSRVVGTTYRASVASPSRGV